MVSSTETLNGDNSVVNSLNNTSGNECNILRVADVEWQSIKLNIYAYTSVVNSNVFDLGTVCKNVFVGPMYYYTSR